MRKLWDIKEAAANTGLTVHYLRQSVARGQIPFIRLGGARSKLLFDADLLEMAFKKAALSNQEERARLNEEYENAKQKARVEYIGDILGNRKRA